MSNWDWQVFCKNTIDGEVIERCFGSGGDITYLDWLMSAWGWTLSVALLALVVALLMGSMVGILRTLPSKGLGVGGRRLDRDVPQHVPLLVQIFLWYHVVPSLIPAAARTVPSFVLVVVGLGFFTSARIAEQVQGGYPKPAQGPALCRLGHGPDFGANLSLCDACPMAFRVVIPPLTSESMNIIKNSSVAFAVSDCRADPCLRCKRRKKHRGVLRFTWR